MKERGLLMCGKMIPATLEDRKTQTRRVIKPQPEKVREGWYADRYNKTEDWTFWGPRGSADSGKCHLPMFRCPYGQPGDRLWVKETHQIVDHMQTTRVIYRADGLYKDESWRPSIFMRRTDSRITLEIVSVRVERLQEISEEDAKAEGCRLEDWRETSRDPLSEHSRWTGDGNPAPQSYSYRNAYRRLWDSLNAKTYPWASNPWVWVIEFRRLNSEAVAS